LLANSGKEWLNIHFLFQECPSAKFGKIIKSYVLISSKVKTTDQEREDALV